MRASLGSNWRRRGLTAVIVALAVGMTLMVSGAFADAGNPINGTIKATAIDNGNTVTIYVRGQWNWLSHNNDCNSDRNGAGVGIIWNDPTEPGYTVTKAPISAQVGIATLRAGDTANQVDQMVHPSDIGNKAEGYLGAAGQTFADPSTPGITAAHLAAWRGGCGREPTTATASPGPGAALDPSGKTCADATLACSGHPWGSWGYTKTTVKNGVTYLGYSHTYEKIQSSGPNQGQSGLPSKVCVNFYDVHGSNAGTEPPNGTKEIDVDGDDGGNGDNSIQTNAFNVNNGANCISVAIPTVTTEIRTSPSNTVVTTTEAGTMVHDLVTVTGSPTTPTGNVTLDWFTNNTCTGAPASTESLPMSGGIATGSNHGPLAAGLYSFKAHYPGDGTFFLAADGPCEPLRVVDANIQISPATATNRIGSPHVLTAHVNTNDGTGFVNAASALVTFSVSGPGSLSNGNVSNTSCSTDAAGNCTITLSSALTGVTTVSAHTLLSVNGISLTRHTDGTGANSAPAQKTWVDAKIAIAPSATNRIGQPHTFTVTLMKDTGNGSGFVAAANEHVGFSLTDSFGANSALNAASSTCDDAGANTDASGKCTIVFNSTTTGKVTGHASSTLTLVGLPVSVATDGLGLNSSDAVKTYVDAKIAITPSTATNRVGDPHTFTVTLLKDMGNGAGFVAAASEHVGFSLTDSFGASSTLNAAASTCDDAGANTDSSGKCTIVFTSNSTGKVTAHATSTLTLAGLPVSVATDGTGLNSGDAVKTYVNAKISIAPSATNRIGQPHTFTVTLLKDTGNGSGFVNAANEHVGFSLTDSLGASSTLNVAASTCDDAGANTNATGQCTIIFTSNTTGKVTGHASSTLTLVGLPVTVETDGTGLNSGNAIKTFVDSKISITPATATNRIGQPHTLTVTLMKDIGDGNGFVVAANEHVNVTLTDSLGASHTAPTGTCTTAGPNTDAAGQCTITFTSNTTGKVTGHASSTLTLGSPSTTFTVETDGLGLNSGNAVKTFVNAKIAITPSAATNHVGDPHTLTVTLMKDAGNGSGFVAAAGEHVDVTLTDSLGATHSAPAGSCTTAGPNTNGSGQCTITYTSNATGKVTGHASSTLTIGAATFTVETDGTGLNSGNAVKTFVDAKIAIAQSATNEVGQQHTFTVTLQKDSGDGSGFVAAPGEHVDVTLTDSNGAIHTAPTGTCTTAGANTNGSGQCTITFNSPTAGKVTAHAVATLAIGTPAATVHVETDGAGGNSGNAVKTYVDANIQINPPTATNRIGQTHTFTAHVNINDGSGAFANAPNGTTINFLILSGPGTLAAPRFCTTAGGTGSCTLDLNSSATGVTTVSASTSLLVGGLSLTRSTNGNGANSAPATKTWVNAKIAIAPSATNRIGQPHTFTVTLMKDTGNGAGLVAAANEHVGFTLTDSLGASSTLNAASSTCDNVGANTDAAGQCTIVFNSTTTGKVTGHASSTLTLAGLPVTVETDGTGLNSGNAVKTYVDAKISITPPTATNRIGDPHTFTVTLQKDTGNGAGFVAAANEHVDFSLSDSLGANSALNALASTCDDAGANTDVNGKCTIVFTSNSTGKVTGHASSTLTPAGLTVTVATDGTGLNSGDAVKTFVNAKIAITPPTATNRVGDPHTFTVTLMKDTGNGAGFVAAANEHVGFTLTDSLGATSTLNALSSTCDDAGANTDAAGKCTIVFNSTTTGKVTGHASSTLTLAGLPVTVATDGAGLNSGNAVKTYVDAKIAIAASATNEVGQPHTFTVTVMKDTGSGAGFVAAPNEHVDFTLTDTNGASSTLNAPSSTCDDAGANTDVNGKCTIVFNSNTAGKVTGHASSTLTLAGLPVTVATDGVGGNSGNAVKTYVDANIQITPATATNPLSTNHTLTGHVNVNAGNGAFANAPNGTTISFSLTNSNGASASFVGANNCTTAGGTGSCNVVINSSTAGTTTIKAITDVTVGGLSLHRETGDAKAGDSVDATKKWAAARISIAPDATNEVGDPHTFTVTLEKDPGTGVYVPAAGEHVNFSLTNSNGAASALDAANSTCDNAGANTNANGQCTITFTSPTAGQVTGHASASLAIGGATVTAATNGAGGGTGDAVKTFVDANIQINPLSATNQVGQTHTFTAHVNVNNGSGGFADKAGALVTFSIDSGPGSLSNGNVSSTSCSTNASGNCTIDLISLTTGVTTISAHTTFSVGGVSLTRNTNGSGANSGPAKKTWANARISIAPDATNEIGDPHTFAVTLEKDPGTGAFVPAQGEHVDFTLTDSNGASATLNAAASTCDNAGANTNASGQCTITFTSQTPGKVTGRASSTLSVNGSAQFTIQTDGVAPNGGNAVKTFVDANIQITPATATNPLSTNHTLTGHVNVNTGSGSFGNAPNGTAISFSLVNSNGASASFVGPNSCTTSGGTGSCDIVINSSTRGTTTIKASTDITVGGVTMHRETGDAKVGDSVDATKKWAAAKISIAPDATNEVGQPHTFTVTLMKDTGTGTFVPAQGEHVAFTLTDSSGAAHTAATGTCTTAGANTDANGQCTITFTSPTAGQVTGHASASLSIGGATITTQTNGAGGSSGDAVKTFVDANIQISPQEATNPLNTTHVLTGHVNVNAGLGGGFVAAPQGTTIDFTKVSGPSTFVGPSSCTTTNASGSCTVTITSGTTGVTIIRAATDVTVGGVQMHRASGDGKAGDSGDATKLWASAKISIAPDATNEVGHLETFTVTLLKDTSNGAFAPAAGERVAVALTDANGAAHSAPTGTCTNAGANTDANGQCTITFTSNTVGTVTGHASSTLVVSGASITVQTNGVAPNSGNALKTFVDANIQVTPASAINPIGTTHTLTGHVNVNAGLGFANAPNGTTINFSLTGPASFVGPGSCQTAGGTGSCTVVISSSTVGTSTIKASTDAAVAGVVLHRESGDAKAGDSANASKLWADDSARTDIFNASGAVVTTVVSGTIVHDTVFVSRDAATPAGVPNPSGNVIFHRFATIDCTGTATNQTVALTPGSPSTAITDDFAPTANMSYQAEYLGDANYPARTAACEPLTVTPVPAPAIAIVKNPKGQTVAIGGTATFSITVTNAGNTVLTDVTITDPLTTSCNRTKADIPALASMAPGATITYTCTKTNVRASFDNVATATGTPPSGPTVSASDTAPVKAQSLTPKKKKIKKKKPKLVSHKKPKATG